MFPIIPSNNPEGEWQTFQFGDYLIRYLIRDVEMWCVAKDACAACGIVNTSDAVSRLAEHEKATIALTDSGGRPYKLIIVSETGLYKLIFSSRKPEAEAFKDRAAQIVREIRQKGVVARADLTQAEVTLRLAQQLVEQEQRLNEHDARLRALEDSADIPRYTVREYFWHIGEDIPRTDILLAIEKQAARLAREHGLVVRDLSRYPVSILARAIQDILGG